MIYTVFERREKQLNVLKDIKLKDIKINGVKDKVEGKDLQFKKPRRMCAEYKLSHHISKDGEITKHLNHM